MPTFDFSLPHWAYWLGLILFPLLAMALAKRPKPARRLYSAALAYMILVAGGLIGLHRFYLKSLLGLVYIPIFLVILYGNSHESSARTIVSNVQNEVRVAQRTLDREQPRLESAKADLEAYKAELATVETGSFAEKSLKRRIDRTEASIPKSEERIAEAQNILSQTGAELEAAKATQTKWHLTARYAFYLLLAFMAVDAVMIPGMVRRANETIGDERISEAEAALAAAEAEEGPKADADHVENWIDRLSLICGEFVSYWAVIAVFVYYFEVISRYVFNSPTNWAHEAMYLMFGMQYLIAGAYAMLTESHVRVDIFYAPLSKPRKAWADLLTSVFFFIFAGTLLFTSWIFAMDALAVPQGNSVVSDWARGETSFFGMLGSLTLGTWTDPAIRWGEISFNEWEIPLWPMKWVMVMGGLLLVLQGVSKVSKDIRAIARGE